jgi:hypothetical protein
VPFPADYGGVIDVFYKLKQLHANGVEIIFHVFENGRGKHPELEKYCSKVYYYKRNSNWLLLFNRLPFIVESRKNKLLFETLMQNNYPILFEGLHTTYYAQQLKKMGRSVYLRNHNIESDYYNELSKVEKNSIKKWYLKWESKKLLKYEKQLSFFDHIFCISKKDTLQFESYKSKHCFCLS